MNGPIQLLDTNNNNIDRERLDIIQLWIGKVLHGFQSKRKISNSVSKVAFGRCKAKEENETYKKMRMSFCSKTRISRLIRLSNIGARTIPIQTNNDSFVTATIHLVPGQQQQQQQQWASVKNSLFSPQDNKHRGRQISNTKFDLKQASEKRNRQIQYAKEIQASRQDKSLDEDSIFRVVVKSFCKLMDCERCSLFWMDHANHELYFKPVGDEGLTGAIRFPASVGIAGWVATNKKLINVRDAYQNEMFHKDVDRRTNFKTRTILCAPVLLDGTLCAVVQMLNKFKDVSCPRELRSSRKGSTKFRKYIPFSTTDEEILMQCCEEVSRAVRGAYSNVVISTIHPPPSVRLDNKENYYKDEKKKTIYNDSSLEDGKDTRTRSRRGSVGTLVKFISNLSKQEDQLPEPDLPINEAVTKLKFRSDDGTSSRRGSTRSRRGSLAIPKTDPLHQHQLNLQMNEVVLKSETNHSNNSRRGSV
jgi:hypothetical protein